MVGGYMKKYALIQDNKIVKVKNVHDNDTVIVPKLLAHNYLPIEEQTVPAYDYITQTLTDNYEIQKSRVLRIWTVTERAFAEAQQAKKDAVKMKALDEIKEAFASVGEKIKVDKILGDKDTAIIAIDAAKDNIDLRNIDTTKKVA